MKTAIALLVLVFMPIFSCWCSAETQHLKQNNTYSVPSANTFEIENGYFKVLGVNGVITSLQFDPVGNGRYGCNHIISFSAGNPVPNPDTKAEIDPSGKELILRGSITEQIIKIDQEAASHAEILRPGGSLGQTFDFTSGQLQSVQVKVPTWNTTDSSLTLSLYRLNGQDRVIVASQRFDKLIDNEWIELIVDSQPGGTFLIEMSDISGMAGWWSLSSNRGLGEAFSDGKMIANVSRCVRAAGSETITGDFHIRLDGSKLLSSFNPHDGQKKPAGTRLVIPWIKSGYDTTNEDIIFNHIRTNRGIYMPVHQFKRRPFSGVSGEWILMSGRFGSDIRFPNASIHMLMDEDSMTLHFPGAEREIEVLPHSMDLGKQYPVFYSSNEKVDRVINEFLLSHNFNFGIGTNPDWKDWHTLQLSWTANGQSDLQRNQFLLFNMDEDGYVYSWGDSPGWPFPYKDDNNDGLNDYDTRHFTTNPCYILGAWREYCWNRNPEYLAKLMPRVRRAMEFILQELEGDKGVFVIRAPGHEGRDGGIASNYWDITPFGWLDAWSNAHFYPALEAMAQMEEAALSEEVLKVMEPDPDIPKRTLFFYRRLAAKAKESYNKAFWLNDRERYAGCIDIDGTIHDYGFTYVNLVAMAHDLADKDQVEQIYDWMENGITASGKADTYTRWIFAPRASTIHRLPRNTPNGSGHDQSAASWWSMSWSGTDYDDQCQAGGAILYTSYYDIVTRARYLGADNAWKRFMQILDRYSKPDRLSGGSPLYYGEITQGGPGGTAGSVGVEGEFPESGLVPVSFFYAFLGINADIHGMTIRPNLPSELEFAGVRNVRYGGKMYDIEVTNTSVKLVCTTEGHEQVIIKTLAPAEVFRFNK